MMRFIADFMLGKLARVLRLLGQDVIYVKPTDRNGMLKMALEEGRVILTRSHKLPHHPSIFVIKSQDWREQLEEVKKAFPLDINPFTRCSICNTELVEVSKTEVRGKVPYHVYEVHDEFAYCPGCGRYYWKGTHYENIKKMLGIEDANNGTSHN